MWKVTYPSSNETRGPVQFQTLSYGESDTPIALTTAARPGGARWVAYPVGAYRSPAGWRLGAGNLRYTPLCTRCHSHRLAARPPSVRGMTATKQASIFLSISPFAFKFGQLD